MSQTACLRTLLRLSRMWQGPRCRRQTGRHLPRQRRMGRCPRIPRRRSRTGCRQIGRPLRTKLNWRHHLQVGQRHCTKCRHHLQMGQRHCTNCRHLLQMGQRHCPNCHHHLQVGQPLYPLCRRRTSRRLGARRLRHGTRRYMTCRTFPLVLPG